MGLIGILIALGLLIWLAYRGWSILLLAPAAAASVKSHVGAGGASEIALIAFIAPPAQADPRRGPLLPVWRLQRAPYSRR
jgi:hypothetical protein